MGKFKNKMFYSLFTEKIKKIIYIIFFLLKVYFLFIFFFYFIRLIALIHSDLLDLIDRTYMVEYSNGRMNFTEGYKVPILHVKIFRDIGLGDYFPIFDHGVAGIINKLQGDYKVLEGADKVGYSMHHLFYIFFMDSFGMFGSSVIGFFGIHGGFLLQMVRDEEDKKRTHLTDSIILVFIILYVIPRIFIGLAVYLTQLDYLYENIVSVLYTHPYEKLCLTDKDFFIYFINDELILDGIIFDNDNALYQWYSNKCQIVVCGDTRREYYHNLIYYLLVQYDISPEQIYQMGDKFVNLSLKMKEAGISVK